MWFTSTSIVTNNNPVVGGNRPDPAINNAINNPDLNPRGALATADNRLIPSGTGSWRGSEKLSLLPALTPCARHRLQSGRHILTWVHRQCRPLRSAQPVDGLGVDDDQGGLSARTSGSARSVAKFTGRCAAQ